MDRFKNPNIILFLEEKHIKCFRGVVPQTFNSEKTENEKRNSQTWKIRS